MPAQIEFVSDIDTVPILGTTPLLTLIVAFTVLEPTDVEPLIVSNVNVAIALVESGIFFSQSVGMV